MPSQSLRGELEEVFTLHRAKLKHVARSIVQNAEHAEEVVQDAYLKVINAADVREIKQPLSYCYQVVRNLALDSYRHNAVESAYRTFVDDLDSVAVPTEGSVGRLLDTRNALVEIDRVLDTLPPRTRQAFELTRLSGLTQREVGRRLGCSATMVNFMIKDADAALKRCRHFLDVD